MKRKSIFFIALSLLLSVAPARSDLFSDIGGGVEGFFTGSEEVWGHPPDWVKKWGESMIGIGNAIGAWTEGAAKLAWEMAKDPKQTPQKFYDSVLMPAKNIGMGVVSVVLSTLIDLVATADEWDRNPPPFCTEKLTNVVEPSIDEQPVQWQDNEHYIPLIKKYSPYIYLFSSEKALPISAPALFTGSLTQMIDKETGQVAVPRGQVTMRKIWEYRFQRPEGQAERDHFFEFPDCVLRGANPKDNTNAEGNLTTPAYVITFSKESKIYLQFIFLFAFNAPYPVKTSLDLVPGLSSDVALDTSNYHEVDIEHMTIEVDKGSQKISRIYFGSHGLKEGMWLDASNSDIQWRGTHPVAFAAARGHGLYPRAGVYPRIYGIANDKTNGKGLLWTPTWVRVYNWDDPRFNPDIHGWIVHLGPYGRHGVGTLVHQSWFNNVAGDIGRDYGSVPFCNENDTLCIKAKGAQATPP